MKGTRSKPLALTSPCPARWCRVVPPPARGFTCPLPRIFRGRRHLVGEEAEQGAPLGSVVGDHDESRPSPRVPLPARRRRPAAGGCNVKAKRSVLHSRCNSSIYRGFSDLESPGPHHGGDDNLSRWRHAVSWVADVGRRVDSRPEGRLPVISIHPSGVRAGVESPGMRSRYSRTIPARPSPPALPTRAGQGAAPRRTRRGRRHRRDWPGQCSRTPCRRSRRSRFRHRRTPG
jgi:hypothetical protein